MTISIKSASKTAHTHDNLDIADIEEVMVKSMP